MTESQNNFKWLMAQVETVSNRWQLTAALANILDYRQKYADRKLVDRLMEVFHKKALIYTEQPSDN